MNVAFGREAGPYKCRSDPTPRVRQASWAVVASVAQSLNVLRGRPKGTERDLGEGD